MSGKAVSEEENACEARVLVRGFQPQNTWNCEYRIRGACQHGSDGVTAFYHSYYRVGSKSVLRMYPFNQNKKSIRYTVFADIIDMIYAHKPRMYVAACHDVALRVYDESFQLISTVRVISTVLSLAFNSLSGEIYSGGIGQVMIWSLKPKVHNPLIQSSQVNCSLGKDEWANILHYDAVSKTLTVGTPISVYVVNVEKNEEIGCFTGRLTKALITCAAHCAKLKYLIFGTNNGAITVWSYKYNAQIHTFEGCHYKRVTGLAVHPWFPCMVSCSWDKTVKMWNLEAMSECYSIHCEEDLLGLCWEYPMLSCYSNYSVKMWTVSQFETHFASLNSEVLRMLRVDGPPPSLIPNMKVARILALADDGGIRLLSPVTGKIITTLFPMFSLQLLSNVVYSHADQLLFVLMKNHYILVCDTHYNPVLVKELWVHTSKEQIINNLAMCTVILPDGRSHSLVFGSQMDGYISLLYSSSSLLAMLSLCPAHDSCMNHLVGSHDPIFTTNSSKEVNQSALVSYGKGGDRLNIWGILADEARSTMKLTLQVSIKMVLRPYLIALMKSTVCMVLENTHRIIMLATPLSKRVPSKNTSRMENLSSLSVMTHQYEDEHKREVTCLNACYYLGMFVSCSKDGTVKIWSLENQLISEMDFGMPLFSVDFANHKGDLLVGLLRYVSKVYAKDYLPDKYYELSKMCPYWDFKEAPIEFDPDLEFWYSFTRVPTFPIIQEIRAQYFFNHSEIDLEGLPSAELKRKYLDSFATGYSIRVAMKSLVDVTEDIFIEKSHAEIVQRTVNSRLAMQQRNNYYYTLLGDGTTTATSSKTTLKTASEKTAQKTASESMWGSEEVASELSQSSKASCISRGSVEVPNTEKKRCVSFFVDDASLSTTDVASAQDAMEAESEPKPWYLAKAYIAPVLAPSKPIAPDGYIPNSIIRRKINYTPASVILTEVYRPPVVKRRLPSTIEKYNWLLELIANKCKKENVLNTSEVIYFVSKFLKEDPRAEETILKIMETYNEDEFDLDAFIRYINACPSITRHPSSVLSSGRTTHMEHDHPIVRLRSPVSELSALRSPSRISYDLSSQSVGSRRLSSAISDSRLPFDRSDMMSASSVKSAMKLDWSTSATAKDASPDASPTTLGRSTGTLFTPDTATSHPKSDSAISHERSMTSQFDNQLKSPSQKSSQKFTPPDGSTLQDGSSRSDGTNLRSALKSSSGAPSPKKRTSVTFQTSDSGSGTSGRSSMGDYSETYRSGRRDSAIASSTVYTLGGSDSGLAQITSRSGEDSNMKLQRIREREITKLLERLADMQWFPREELKKSGLTVDGVFNQLIKCLDSCSDVEIFGEVCDSLLQLHSAGVLNDEQKATLAIQLSTRLKTCTVVQAEQEYTCSSSNTRSTSSSSRTTEDTDNVPVLFRFKTEAHKGADPGTDFKIVRAAFSASDINRRTTSGDGFESETAGDGSVGGGSVGDGSAVDISASAGECAGHGVKSAKSVAIEGDGATIGGKRAIHVDDGTIGGDTIGGKDVPIIGDADAVDEGTSAVGEGDAVDKGTAIVGEGIAVVDKGVAVGKGVAVAGKGVAVVDKGVAVIEGTTIVDEGVAVVSEGVAVVDEGVTIVDEGVPVVEGDAVDEGTAIDESVAGVTTTSSYRISISGRGGEHADQTSTNRVTISCDRIIVSIHHVKIDGDHISISVDRAYISGDRASITVDSANITKGSCNHVSIIGGHIGISIDHASISGEYAKISDGRVSIRGDPVSGDRVKVSDGRISIRGDPVSGDPVKFSDRVSIAGDPVSASGDRVKFSDDRVSIAGDPVSVSGDCVKFSDDRVSIAGDPVSVSGDRVKFSDDCVSIAGDRVSGDRVKVSDDRVSIAGDPVSVSGDCVKFSDDRVSIAGDPVSVSGDRVKVSDDRVSIAGDRVSGGRVKVSDDRVSIAGDPVSVSGDRVKVSDDRVSIAGDPVSVSGDRVKVSDDRVNIAGDLVSVSGDCIKVSDDRVSIAGDPVSVSGDHVIVSEDHVSISGDHVCVSGDHVSISVDGAKISDDHVSISVDCASISGDQASISIDHVSIDASVGGGVTDDCIDISCDRIMLTIKHARISGDDVSISVDSVCISGTQASINIDCASVVRGSDNHLNIIGGHIGISIDHASISGDRTIDHVSVTGDHVSISVDGVRVSDQVRFSVVCASISGDQASISIDHARFSVRGDSSKVCTDGSKVSGSAKSAHLVPGVHAIGKAISSDSSVSIFPDSDKSGSKEVLGMKQWLKRLASGDTSGKPALGVDRITIRLLNTLKKLAISREELATGSNKEDIIAAILPCLVHKNTKVRSNAFDAAHAAGINTRAKLRQFLENAGLMKTYIQNENEVMRDLATHVRSLLQAGYDHHHLEKYLDKHHSWSKSRRKSFADMCLKISPISLHIKRPSQDTSEVHKKGEASLQKGEHYHPILTPVSPLLSTIRRSPLHSAIRGKGRDGKDMKSNLDMDGKETIDEVLPEYEEICAHGESYMSRKQFLETAEGSTSLQSVRIIRLGEEQGAPKKIGYLQGQGLDSKSKYALMEMITEPLKAEPFKSSLYGDKDETKSRTLDHLTIETIKPRRGYYTDSNKINTEGKFEYKYKSDGKLDYRFTLPTHKPSIPLNLSNLSQREPTHQWMLNVYGGKLSDCRYFDDPQKRFSYGWRESHCALKKLPQKVSSKVPRKKCHFKAGSDETVEEKAVDDEEDDKVPYIHEKYFEWIEIFPVVKTVSRFYIDRSQKKPVTPFKSTPLPPIAMSEIGSEELKFKSSRLWETYGNKSRNRHSETPTELSVHA